MSSYSSPNIVENGTIDLQYNLLFGCLVSLGVNWNNIHHRNSSPAYDELNFQWNSLNGHVEPLAYLVAHHVSDVQKAVTCCGLTKVRIVARSGGHSYIKTGFGDSRSLIVDLAKMNHISVDPKDMISEIGAGAKVAVVSFTLWKNGKFLIPSGICPTVGIAGLTLGGGYGRFTTVFGLTSDSVVEMEMVDAIGQLLVINNSTNSDLFWALRGGGGGNFGIVTKFKFKIYKAPRSVVYVRNEFGFENFLQFYRAWQTLMNVGVPRHFSLLFRIFDNHISMGSHGFNFQYQNETVESVTNFLSSFSFPNATSSSSKVMSYEEFMVADASAFSSAMIQTVSQLENMTKYDAVVEWKKVKSMFVDQILNERQIYALKDLFIEYMPYLDVAAEPNNAVVNSLPPSDTAFVHRGTNLFDLQFRASSVPPKQPDFQADRAIRMLFEKSKSVFHHRESYQNYMDQDLTDYLVRYYGSNLDRLVSIKRRYDPGNMFHHPQSIPVNMDLSGK
ncbi:chitooligosaccharide oxidase-like [Bradysia coprophila]|uniref:chitooligosaccharide oxidase-like n=1 Tax=Bradysia coprophila TaxID=38358 RepID=UPI00187D9A35|nr:chitooligosaccharide oxidase-like [Bradysia coprophila]